MCGPQGFNKQQLLESIGTLELDKEFWVSILLRDSGVQCGGHVLSSSCLSDCGHHRRRWKPRRQKVICPPPPWAVPGGVCSSWLRTGHWAASALGDEMNDEVSFAWWHRGHRYVSGTVITCTVMRNAKGVHIGGPGPVLLLPAQQPVLPSVEQLLFL